MDETADNWLTLNGGNWDERVAIHAASDFYDLPGFRSCGVSTLRSFEPEENGPVEGRSLLHLQCHMGQDTLSWAMRGVTVTGLDFSEPAVETAAARAADCGPADRAVRRLRRPRGAGDACRRALRHRLHRHRRPGLAARSAPLGTRGRLLAQGRRHAVPGGDAPGHQHVRRRRPHRCARLLRRAGPGVDGAVLLHRTGPGSAPTSPTSKGTTPWARCSPRSAARDCAWSSSTSTTARSSNASPRCCAPDNGEYVRPAGVPRLPDVLAAGRQVLTHPFTPATTARPDPPRDGRELRRAAAPPPAPAGRRPPADRLHR